MIALYVKTHRKTGLKYLGKTVSDPYSYKGSGVRWSRHLAKHGDDVDTIVIMWCADNASAKAWGIYYSDLWNVVDSTEWANLKREEGDGGWEHVNSNKDEAYREQRRRLGKKNPPLPHPMFGKDNPNYGIKRKRNFAIDKENQSKACANAQSLTARTKRIKTLTKIGHQQGSKNSQHGTRWVSDNLWNMKLPAACRTPNGWEDKRVIGLPSIPKELKQLYIAEASI